MKLININGNKNPSSCCSVCSSDDYSSSVKRMENNSILHLLLNCAVSGFIPIHCSQYPNSLFPLLSLLLPLLSRSPLLSLPSPLFTRSQILALYWHGAATNTGSWAGRTQQTASRHLWSLHFLLSSGPTSRD